MTMSLEEKLADDLKRAMKTGDTLRRSVIRLVLADIKNAEIARQAKLSDPDILNIIRRDVRRRQETIEECKKANRPDLESKEEAELAILREYLPAQVTREEVVEAARKMIEEVGARGPKDKGKVMPKLIANLGGRADSRLINEVVSELLSGG